MVGKTSFENQTNQRINKIQLRFSWSTQNYSGVLSILLNQIYHNLHFKAASKYNNRGYLTKTSEKKQKYRKNLHAQNSLLWRSPLLTVPKIPWLKSSFFYDFRSYGQIISKFLWIFLLLFKSIFFQLTVLWTLFLFASCIFGFWKFSMCLK